jgi:uncharacterized membrane protein YeaQ/YmgE (transglycosylase-associated protein family)
MLVTVICWIALGLVAGFVANKVVRERPEAMSLDLTLGVIGAIVGGWIFRSVGSDGANGLNLWSLFVSVSGASVLLMAWHAIAGWNVEAMDMDQMS